jgi:hypothetical protein
MNAPEFAVHRLSSFPLLLPALFAAHGRAAATGFVPEFSGAASQLFFWEQVHDFQPTDPLVRA